MKVRSTGFSCLAVALIFLLFSWTKGEHLSRLVDFQETRGAQVVQSGQARFTESWLRLSLSNAAISASVHRIRASVPGHTTQPTIHNIGLGYCSHRQQVVGSLYECYLAFGAGKSGAPKQLFIMRLRVL